MSDLSATEKRKLERLLDMGTGYVAQFSNRTFSEFVTDSTGRDIYDAKYAWGSGSKANRMRAFWNEEPNPVVAKLLNDLLNYAGEFGWFAEKITQIEECRRIISRLQQAGPVAEVEVLSAIAAEKDFDTVAAEVRAAIEKNQPEIGLDRLHTFVTKYIRTICVERGIATDREKPLHSMFGEYVKKLADTGELESVMTERILKSSISVLEAFSHVRNEQSLAHDNPLLNYEEALLIFNNVTNTVRFVRNLEARLRRRKQAVTPAAEPADEIPF